MRSLFGENSTLAARLFWKRAFVRAVFWSVRLAGAAYGAGRRVIDAAAARGLNVREAWNVAPRERRADEFAPQPFGVHDFLLLTDALAAARRGEEADGATLIDHATNDQGLADQTTADQASADQIATTERAPLASVIIPVFNKAELTFQCLRSLVREVDLSETEIIVVDNASTDETAQLLARFTGVVRVLTNAENRGFVDACNQGAERARGRHLVFLNNDTVVLPGWLDELIRTVESDDSIGAVGSLLLYPDGRVQEAGGIVWRDGAASHYGWGGAPDDARYAFARDVDYCSGASLLVRRELFARLGGFDRRYAPAYYEDVDLCFAVRAAGRRVRFQPLSRVVHHEGATAGADTSAGYKRFQTINREKFFDKWRTVLEREHFEYRPSNVRPASVRSDAPSVIVFDDRLPAPDRDAGGARMAFILSSLARWSRPVFVSTSNQRAHDYERRLWREGIETAPAADYPRLLRERTFSAAVASRPDVADALIPALRRLAPRTRVVFDMVDVHFIRSEREARVTGDARAAEAARRYREIETRLARESDLVWCATADDRREMLRAAPGARIEVVPTIHAPAARGKSFDERRDLFFLGNFSHAPNRDAVLFFVAEVLPLVRESLKDVKLLVVGDNVPPEIAALASPEVWVLGYVPDIEPLFASARVMVAPLRFGAGMKGKIGESLAHGLPVVTTNVGAEGIGLADGVEALIADDARAFADAVARAYTDAALWRKLSDASYAHLAANFTPELVRRVIDDSLRETIGLAASNTATRGLATEGTEEEVRSRNAER